MSAIARAARLRFKVCYMFSRRLRRCDNMARWRGAHAVTRRLRYDAYMLRAEGGLITPDTLRLMRVRLCLQIYARSVRSDSGYAATSAYVERHYVIYRTPSAFIP